MTSTPSTTNGRSVGPLHWHDPRNPGLQPGLGKRMGLCPSVAKPFIAIEKPRVRASFMARGANLIAIHSCLQPRISRPSYTLGAILCETFDGHGTMNEVAHIDDVDLKVLDLQADLPLLERWLRSPHVVRWWGTPDLHLTDASSAVEGHTRRDHC